MNDFNRIQRRMLELTCAQVGSSVRIRQTRHSFLFGCTAFELSPLANHEIAGAALEQAERHETLLHDVFNYFTLPFYWGQFEREEGKPDIPRTLRTAERLVSRGAIVKGHPLCWHTVCADWLMRYSNEGIFGRQLDRIRREVKAFDGLIDRWDVVNEAVIMPVFDKYDNAITRICWEKGRVEIVRSTFQAARETNPTASLVLNDFDMSTAFECLIEAVLEAGVQIDAIGLQSHMHQGWWGVEKTRDVLRRFSRFGIPLHFTETTLVSGDLMPAHIGDLNDWQVDSWPTHPEGEERQAQELTAHYSLLFNHPAVRAITWWGANDGGWLKAPSGLLRQDDSPKPAYEALKRLVKHDWWLNETEFCVDAHRRVGFEAAPGSYEVQIDGRWVPFEIAEGEAALKTINLHPWQSSLPPSG